MPKQRLRNVGLLLLIMMNTQSLLQRCVLDREHFTHVRQAVANLLALCYMQPKRWQQLPHLLGSAPDTKVVPFLCQEGFASWCEIASDHFKQRPYRFLVIHSFGREDERVLLTGWQKCRAVAHSSRERVGGDVAAGTIEFAVAAAEGAWELGPGAAAGKDMLVVATVKVGGGVAEGERGDIGVEVLKDNNAGTSERSGDSGKAVAAAKFEHAA